MKQSIFGLVICALLAFAQPAMAQKSKGRYKPGGVILQAGRSLITMPFEVKKLLFDTAQYDSSWKKLPSWRFLGTLKVDSLVLSDSTVAVTSEAQMEGIVIGSPELTDALRRVNISVLMKGFPNRVPADTLFWDSIRQKWHKLPDPSVFYEIRFDKSLSLDWVLEQLKVIPDLGVGRIPIPKLNDWIKSAVTPWNPNDSAFNGPNRNWALTSKQPDNTGGISAASAWGLLDYGFRGIVEMAVIDPTGVDHDHEDLLFKWDGWIGEDYYVTGEPHGTEVAGIALAETHNGIGIAGVAPDAILYTFTMGWPSGEALFADFDTAIIAGASVICFAAEYSEASTDSTTAADLRTVLERARAENIPVVVGAGNGDSTDIVPYVSYPSRWDSLCISVGAHDSLGQRPSWSNHGIDCYGCPRFPDILAPGVDVATTSFDSSNNDTYINMSGTSAATAIVAGMVALMRGYDYSLTTEQIERLLESTAVDTLLYQPDSLKFGGGNVDAFRFLNSQVNTSVKDRVVVADSVPCLIITAQSFVSRFQELADRKTYRGTRTDIVTVEYINTTYPGEDLQARIRACIQDYKSNKFLEWVILGGDGAIVPYRYVFNNLRGPGVNFISDQYYACLDGDWNFDGDTLYGEVEDSVDLIPDVAVGRLPFSYSADVMNYISKLYIYEHAWATGGWPANVLTIGSEMFSYADGKGMSQDLLSYFPSSFSITERYDDVGGTASLVNYFADMNSGQGIVIKYGMAYEEPSTFFLHRRSWWDKLQNDNVDTLANFGMPSVVFSSTCWNNKLDSDCLSKHYMKRTPNAGAVAYVGATYNDFVFHSHNITVEFFNKLFSNGSTEIGSLLNAGKAIIEPSSHEEGASRHSVMGYTLLGDPQMRIWASDPIQMQHHRHVTSKDADQYVTVTDTLLDAAVPYDPIAGALVCLSYSDSAAGIYETALTDSAGIVEFYFLAPQAGASLRIVAGKQDHVYTGEVITIVSCCTGMRGDTNGDGGDAADISDLTYLTAYVFQGGPPPPCMLEADVNGSGMVDIADLTYLIATLFNGGPAPVACPTTKKSIVVSLD